MVGAFAHVVLVPDTHALREWGIIVFPHFVIVVTVTGERIEQGRPFEGFIENGEVLVVIVQQAGSETGVGHNHLVHGMHHAVFHGVVLQFVDDGGTPVDDAECHSVSIDRVSVGHDDYGQVKLVAFLMCFGQVVCVQCPFYQAGFDERVAKRCRNVLDGGVSPFFQEIFHAGVHGREQRPRPPACQ